MRRHDKGRSAPMPGDADRLAQYGVQQLPKAVLRFDRGHGVHGLLLVQTSQPVQYGESSKRFFIGVSGGNGPDRIRTPRPRYAHCGLRPALHSRVADSHSHSQRNPSIRARGIRGVVGGPRPGILLLGMLPCKTSPQSKTRSNTDQTPIKHRSYQPDRYIGTSIPTPKGTRDDLHHPVQRPRLRLLQCS